MATTSSANPVDEVIPLRFAPAAPAPNVQNCPEWIVPEVWLRHRLSQSVTLEGANGVLQVLARRSDDGRHISVFLKNLGKESVRVRIPPPAEGWKFTAHGRWVMDEQNPSKGTWQFSPSLPLPLPKEVILEPQTLVLINMAEMISLPQPETDRHERKP